MLRGFTPDLSGRTALVTGSAKRVGRELLLSIADCGADVVVHYNERDAADYISGENVAVDGGRMPEFDG